MIIFSRTPKQSAFRSLMRQRTLKVSSYNRFRAQGGSQGSCYQIQVILNGCQVFSLNSAQVNIPKWQRRTFARHVLNSFDDSETWLFLGAFSILYRKVKGKQFENMKAWWISPSSHFVLVKGIRLLYIEPVDWSWEGARKQPQRQRRRTHRGHLSKILVRMLSRASHLLHSTCLCQKRGMHLWSQRWHMNLEILKWIQTFHLSYEVRPKAHVSGTRQSPRSSLFFVGPSWLWDWALSLPPLLEAFVCLLILLPWKGRKWRHWRSVSRLPCRVLASRAP